MNSNKSVAARDVSAIWSTVDTDPPVNAVSGTRQVVAGLSSIIDTARTVHVNAVSRTNLPHQPHSLEDQMDEKRDCLNCGTKESAPETGEGYQICDKCFDELDGDEDYMQSLEEKAASNG